MRGLAPETLAGIYAEIEAALGDVPGLRVGKWGAVPNPPGAYLSLPESIERMTGGSIMLNELMVTVVVGRATDRNSLLEIMRLTGAVSEAVDSRRWSTFSDLSISRIEYDTVTVAGAPDVYLAALFHCDLAGA